MRVTEKKKIIIIQSCILSDYCLIPVIIIIIATLEDAHWRFLAHEQATAVLRMISFQNPSCQAEMVTAGAIKHLVRLCDVFNPEGYHSNCCKSLCEHSSDASKLFHDLTYKKKLVGKVKEMTLEDIRENAVKLIRTGEKEILFSTYHLRQK